MNLYPICLKLEDKNICVIGGGDVACRKVKTLYKSTHNITVVSPELCSGLKSMHKAGKFKYCDSRYSKKFIKDAFLVIAATNDQKVNQKIAQDAMGMGKLINVVDVPELCNFYLPSVIDDKGILLSISTQGKFPGLARKLRESISGIIGCYAENLKTLSVLREQIKENCKSGRLKKTLLEKILDMDVIEEIRKGRISDLDSLKKYLKIR